jgi:uncharacterized membrane protein
MLEFLIFIDFWIIIIVLAKGSFVYKLISICGNYLSVHKIWQPVAFFIVTICLWKAINIHSKRNLLDIFKKSWLYFLTLLIVYNALVIPVVLSKYFSFWMRQAHDFALRQHAIYNTLIGNILRTDIYNWYVFKNWNFLGDHFSPFILFYAPMYYFFPDGSCLLVTQSIILSTAAIPIYLIAQNILKKNTLSLLVALSYLLYPIVIQLYFHEMRIEYNAIPLLLFAFYCIQKDRIWTAFVLLMISGTCKEEVFLAVSMFGLYIVFCKKGLRIKLVGIFVTLLGIAIFTLIIEYIMPSISGRTYYGYGPLGGRDKIIDLLFFNQKKILEYLEPWRIKYFIDIFKAFGFLPLLSPMMLLGCPFLLQNWISDITATTDHTWHSALIVPFLFLGLIYGIYTLMRFSKNMYIAVLIWLGCFTLIFGGVDFKHTILDPFFEAKMYLSVKTKRYEEFIKAKSYLPEGKSFFTQFALLPHLSNRENIFWKETCPDADAINTDFLFFSPDMNVVKGEKEIFEELIKSKKYEEIYSFGSFIVMVRKDLVYKADNIISNFTCKKDLDAWKINVCNCEYKIMNELGGFIISTKYNGKNDEDEFVQMRQEGFSIDLREYPFFFMDYGIVDTTVQTIEVVFGIDFNGDGYVDNILRRNYIDDGVKRGSYEFNLYSTLCINFPDKACYEVLEIEIYPHKKYGVDCSNKKEWYKYKMARVGFKGFKFKK